MKVSIIIPVYNEQDFIKKSIESIINQTTKPQKVIYVNDSSTDESRSIIEEFSEKYKNMPKLPPFRHFAEPPWGHRNFINGSKLLSEVQWVT